MEKFFVLKTYIMLTILIPGIPLMVILALNGNPSSRLSDWLQSRRKPVLAAYSLLTAVALIIATYWLSTAEIWTFIKFATVPTLILTGAVIFPWTQKGRR